MFFTSEHLEQAIDRNLFNANEEDELFDTHQQIHETLWNLWNLGLIEYDYFKHVDGYLDDLFDDYLRSIRNGY